MGKRNCQKCESNRILQISGKTSDLVWAKIGDREQDDGYVPSGMNIGSGDYLEFNVCLECGQMQGKFPVSQNIVDREFPPPEPEEDTVEDAYANDKYVIHNPVDKLPFNNFNPNKVRIE